MREAGLRPPLQRWIGRKSAPKENFVHEICFLWRGLSSGVKSSFEEWAWYNAVRPWTSHLKEYEITGETGSCSGGFSSPLFNYPPFHGLWWGIAIFEKSPRLKSEKNNGKNLFSLDGLRQLPTLRSTQIQQLNISIFNKNFAGSMKIMLGGEPLWLWLSQLCNKIVPYCYGLLRTT